MNTSPHRQKMATGIILAMVMGSFASAKSTEPPRLAKPGPASAILEVSMTRASAHELMRPRSMFEAPPAVTQFKLGTVKDVTFVCYWQGTVKNDQPDVRCDAYEEAFARVQVKPDAIKIAQLTSSEVLVEFGGQQKQLRLEPQVPQELKVDGMQIILKLNTILVP